jgi:LAO/AO transport system kinase
MVSALTGEGLEELWGEIGRHRERLAASGELAAKRRRQQVQWMWAMLDHRLMQALQRHPVVRALLPELERSVAEGRLTPTLAVERVLTTFGIASPTGAD